MLYKLADQLTQSLTRPFLIDMGYNADQRGVVVGVITLVATFGGAIFGSWVTTFAGLGHALWIFGFLQLFSNLGYYVLSDPRQPDADGLVWRNGIRAAGIRAWVPAPFRCSCCA